MDSAAQSITQVIPVQSAPIDVPRSTEVVPVPPVPHWSRAARGPSLPGAWALMLPVDVIALAVPVLWVNGYWRGLVAMMALTVAVFTLQGLYVGRRHLSFLDVVPTLLMGMLVSAAIVGVVAAQRHDSLDYVGGFMRAVVQSAGLLLVGRLLTISIVRLARRRRMLDRRAVIVGGGPLAAYLTRVLATNPSYGLRVVGYLADNRATGSVGEAVPWLGPVQSLETVMERSGVAAIIVADTDTPDDRVIELLRRPAPSRAILFVVPRLYHVSRQSGAADHIGAVPIHRVRQNTFTGPRWWAKRTVDIVISLLGLVVCSPLFLLCSLLVLLDGGPGVLYRQERVGRDGRPFEVIKFRSMVPASKTEGDTQWSIAGDKRVRPIGRFLRRTSLDELPQLWNILRGDMTLVGPRPERPHFVEQFSAEFPEYADRHRVPVGLTGLAQVSGLRGDTPIADRARFDNYYIENWSLWLDFKVAVRTFGELFRRAER